MKTDQSTRPNILFIMTDQQHYRMLSCTGNPHVKTPAMDRLAAQGTRFDLGYSANPVCLPARTGMMTGHYPSRFGVGDNADGATHDVAEPYLRQSMGWLLSEAGYETVYGGKTHWASGMNPKSIGFGEMLTTNSYDELADRTVAFLKRDHEKPFLCVASFHNPHDICLMALDAFTKATNQPLRYQNLVADREHLAEALKLPSGMSRQEFFEAVCPPLPENYEPPVGEPPAAGPDDDFKCWVRENWTDEDWRLHRWAYARLTERVDSQIGKVLDALRDAGLEENTVVVFSSDHGDMDASHRLEHKPNFYEEASHVPFIVSWKGVTPAGHVDRTHLVNASLDLIPTFCEFAGIQAPEGLPGMSVRALSEGGSVSAWRDHVVVERYDGRMIRGPRYKYGVYDRPERQEELYDLREDPGEMNNLVQCPEHAAIADDLRAALRSWVDAYDDGIGQSYVPRQG